MPLQRRYTEIPLRGLDERSDDRSIAPGNLSIAKNVEFSAPGAVTKRRGYDRVALSGAEVASLTVDELTHQCGTYMDELLIFGHTHLYALLDQDAGVEPGSRAIVERGLLTRCGLSIQDVASSANSDYEYEEPPG